MRITAIFIVCALAFSVRAQGDALDTALAAIKPEAILLL